MPEPMRARTAPTLLIPALTTVQFCLASVSPHPQNGFCFYFHFFLKAAAGTIWALEGSPWGGLLTCREGRASSGFFSEHSCSLL